jgi:hypothetical protein
MNGFGFDLELEVRGGPSVPLAAITSLEVLGPAPLPDGPDASTTNGWAPRSIRPRSACSCAILGSTRMAMQCWCSGQ